MNRRKFLGLLVGGVAAEAAVRTWPFRVFSFPPAPTVVRIESLNMSGWITGIFPENTAALEIEKIRHLIPVLYEQDDLLGNLLKLEKAVPISWKRLRVPMQS